MNDVDRELEMGVRSRIADGAENVTSPLLKLDSKERAVYLRDLCEACGSMLLGVKSIIKLTLEGVNQFTNESKNVDDTFLQTLEFISHVAAVSEQERLRMEEQNG